LQKYPFIIETKTNEFNEQKGLL